ncbi:hypothetical protein BAUCODRAFT_485678 [Baudoinia panamericana UAMH 10762]|uniref:Uncharacterized protein n=1 Tax=Baudoinia panamericana (strain UAMH 10762) TaxID=717646 RepID=M2MJ28_BAUPA|nr:uncharacterized protein BAUCODRAFT_485678 [Baudoinia panamericana UAMH 10762]EMC96676.1 hypothetical protein BAUCODRAFT_485678 [Baudoinia panamericana UAMH 10762]
MAVMQTSLRISVDLPAVMDVEGIDPSTRYELSTQKLPTQAALSYADLDVAFAEIANRREEFISQGVLIGATGKVRMTWSVNAYMLSQSLWERINALR